MFASVIEKDDVRDDLGGILDVYAFKPPPCDVADGLLRRRGGVGDSSLIR